MTTLLENPVGEGRAGTPLPAESGAQGIARPTSLRWSSYPLIDAQPDFRALSDAEIAAALASGVSEDTISKYWTLRETRIKNARGYFQRNGKWVFEPDPLRFGLDLPHWPIIRHYLQQREEVFTFGGNDSAKTTLMAKLICEVLTRRLELPNVMEGPPQICCIAQNETMSKRVQQKKVYEYLPVELRRANDSGAPRRRTAAQKLTYSDDGGFTNGSLSLAHPRGAAVIYRNVTQFERNELSLEGDGFHLVPVDESCPLTLLETLRFRAAKKKGRLLYCFTPLGGFDQVCNNVFTGARIIAYLPMQWDWTYQGRAGSPLPAADGAQGTARPTIDGTHRSDGQFIPKGAEAIAQWLTGGINPEIQFPEIDLNRSYVEGCPPGHMPFVMQPLNPKLIIIFTWSHWNPFAPRSDFNRHLPAIADKCVGRGHRIALCRLFGYTEKLAGALIPNFRPDYWPKGHLIKHEELLEILRKEPHNLRNGADPATARSWFVGWKAVLKNGLDERPMQYLVAESPDTSEGEWVTPDGDRGDGQKVLPGGDVDFYKRYLREREQRIAAEIYGATIPKGYIFEPPDLGTDVLRAGDSRGFGAPTAGTPETKFLELFLRDDSGKDPLLAPMIFRPAKLFATVWADVGHHGDTGKLIDLFACDWDKPIDATNHPHLLVSDRCKNFIACILNWDGKKQTLDGKPINSPYADGVDMGRVLFDQEIGYIDPQHSAVTGGGAWG